MPKIGNSRSNSIAHSYDSAAVNRFDGARVMVRRDRIDLVANSCCSTVEYFTAYHKLML